MKNMWPPHVVGIQIPSTLASMVKDGGSFIVQQVLYSHRFHIPGLREGNSKQMESWPELMGPYKSHFYKLRITTVKAVSLGVIYMHV